MITLERLALSAALGLVLLAGCARGKDEQMAYDLCLAAAKKDPHYAKATFASKEQSNIPYELDGKKGLYQCIADKQTDGTYKVTF